jgi:hypothetical protein
MGAIKPREEQRRTKTDFSHNAPADKVVPRAGNGTKGGLEGAESRDSRRSGEAEGAIRDEERRETEERTPHGGFGISDTPCHLIRLSQQDDFQGMKGSRDPRISGHSVS